MADVGRPSVMDDNDKMSKIKELVLEGKTDKEIYQIMGIPRTTWETWKGENFRGFKDVMLSYKHERIINKAEANIEQSMSSDDERIRVDVSKFVLERLNKKEYSTRSEITGKDGDAIEVALVPITSITDTLYENNEPITSEDIGGDRQVTEGSESSSV